VATEEGKDWYRFTGMKNASDETSTLILEGSSTNPKVAIRKGEEVELTEAQVEAAKGLGARISTVTDEKVKALEEERKAEEEDEPERGSQQRPTAATGSSTSSGKAGDKPKS
jgi:hypothetical protein